MTCDKRSVIYNHMCLDAVNIIKSKTYCYSCAINWKFCERYRNIGKQYLKIGGHPIKSEQLTSVMTSYLTHIVFSSALSLDY